MMLQFRELKSGQSISKTYSKTWLKLNICLAYGSKHTLYSKYLIIPATRKEPKVKYNLSLVMRKPDFRIFENKDADQLLGNREADQRLCFRYTDSPIPLLPKSEISSL